MKPKILISACLLGEKVKYDGKDNFYKHPILEQWRNEGLLIAICPEVLGGLGVPRAACEVVQGSMKVVNKKGEDKTDFFMQGALKTLQIAQNNNVKIAILKARSPSCGKDEIYDGSFTHQLVRDSGITCKLLQEEGISVFSEDEIALAKRAFEQQGKA